MKLIIVDNCGKTLYECENVEIRPATKRVFKHRTTVADLVWGIINRNKIGML